MKKTDEHVNSQKQACMKQLCRLPDILGHLLFWPIAICGLTFDLWSKKAVFEWLATLPNETYVVIHGYISFILRQNAGAAFSIMYGQRAFLVGISIAAFFAVVGIFLFGGVHRRITQIAMACMVGGITGNLYDRAFNHGLVRDFIDVMIPVIQYNWPTFNVADSLLCIGVGLLIISNLTAPADQKCDLPQTKAR